MFENLSGGANDAAEPGEFAGIMVGNPSSRGFGLVATGEQKLKGAAFDTPLGDIVEMTTVGRTINL